MRQTAPDIGGNQEAEYAVGVRGIRRRERLRRRGHGERMGVAWRVVWAVLYRPVMTMVRVEYRHMEWMPQQGPLILVANHVSHVDPLLLSAFVLDAARIPRFLAKESIFAVPVVGTFMRWMGHIPVKRGSMDARVALAAAVATLENGGTIVMHPEGTVTRDPDGWPMAARTGVARLVTLVPTAEVIPLAQWGVQDQIDLYRKKIKLIPRPRHVISVGEPIDLSAYRDREPTTAVLKEITEVIMRRLRADVAELRGLPIPDGELYRWTRPSDAA